MAPLVAVVTPVYNGGRYLAETLASVQAQTYPRLIHVLLDNASTDATPELIEQARGGRVPILARRNCKILPAGHNWDAAVRITPTDPEYCRVLCADDLMSPDAIAKIVAVGSKDPGIGLIDCLIGMGGTPTQPGRIEASRLPIDRDVFDGRWAVKGYLIGNLDLGMAIMDGSVWSEPNGGGGARNLPARGAKASFSTFACVARQGAKQGPVRASLSCS